MDTGDRLLTPGEVAALFRVDPKTVTRWAAAGRIGSIRTPGGHRRFRESEVRALLEGEAWSRRCARTTPPTGPRNAGPTNPGMGYGAAQRAALSVHARPARPPGEQRVRHAERVQHLARHEVDQLLRRWPARRRRRSRGWPAAPPRRRRAARSGAPGGCGSPASPAAPPPTGRRSLRLTSAARCSRSLDSPMRDAGARRRAGRHDDHAPGRVRAAARPGARGRRPASRPRSAGRVAGPARRPGRRPSARPGTATPVSSRMRQPGGPGHHQVDRLAGVEQRARARPRGVRACRDAPETPTTQGAASSRRSPDAMPLSHEARAIRSASANTNSAMPTKPLAVKNARLTRDRSVGRDDRRARRRTRPRSAPARSTTASRSPTSAPNQTNSANVTTCATVETRSAARDAEAGRDASARRSRRSTSASWQA